MSPIVGPRQPGDEPVTGRLSPHPGTVLWSMRRGSCRTLEGAILGLDASDFDCVRQIHFDRLRREVELALRNHNDLGSHKQIPSGHACNKHSSPYAQPSPPVDLARPGVWRNLDLLAPHSLMVDKSASARRVHAHHASPHHRWRRQGRFHVVTQHSILSGGRAAQPRVPQHAARIDTGSVGTPRFNCDGSLITCNTLQPVD